MARHPGFEQKREAFRLELMKHDSFQSMADMLEVSRQAIEDKVGRYNLKSDWLRHLAEIKPFCGKVIGSFPAIYALYFINKPLHKILHNRII